MLITDTHCHIDVSDFDHDRRQVLDNCQQNNIKKIIVPAINRAGWDNLLHICHQYPGLYPALGLHPVFIDEHRAADSENLNTYIEKVKPVAVGEIGLDFYLKELNASRQINIFEQQLDVARNHSLPVILHVRKAHDKVLQLLKKHRVQGGTCHAFNGSLDQARQYRELGFKLGFGGTMTYPNARKIHQLASDIELSEIVLETDAPDMVVAEHQGERNSPEYILDSLAALSRIKQLDTDTIAEQTSKNAAEIFNI